MFTRCGAELSKCTCASFTDIPSLFEIKDAAKIDGCGPFGIFWRIILPLSKPEILLLD
jgi:multiple sugar transport system permease protein